MIGRVLLLLVAVALVSCSVATALASDIPLKQAQAEQVQSETRWYNTQREIELPLIKAEREAETQARIAQIEADTRAYEERRREEGRIEREQNNRWLEFESYLAIAAAVFVAALGLTVCFALALGTLIGAAWIWKHVDRMLSTPSNPWADPAFRLHMRQQAQEREQASRTPTQPVSGLALIAQGNGRKQAAKYEELPQI